MTLAEHLSRMPQPPVKILLPLRAEILEKAEDRDKESVAKLVSQVEQAIQKNTSGKIPTDDGGSVMTTASGIKNLLDLVRLNLPSLLLEQQVNAKNQWIIDQLKTKAEQGDAESAWRLGDAYSTGTLLLSDDCLLTVSRDLDKALHWSRQAVALGSWEAMPLLGTLLTDSRNPMRVKEGIAWLRRSYRKGIPEAAQNLAIVYSELGNPRRCVFWLRKTCLHAGHADWFHLAIAFAAGYGVRKNLKEAKRLFTLVESSPEAFPVDREEARGFLSMLSSKHPIRVVESIGKTHPDIGVKGPRGQAHG